MSNSNSTFQTDKLEDMRTINRLITEVVDVMSVDFLNGLGKASGFISDLVMDITKTTLWMGKDDDDDDQSLLIVTVDFVDKYGNEDANGFIYIGDGDKIYVDFPY